MNRTLLLTLLASTMIVIALFGVNGLLLALSLPLLLLIAFAILLAPEKLQLEAERVLSSEKVASGGTLHVALTLRNSGSRLTELHISDRIPAGLEVISGESRTITQLAAGASVTLDYELRGPRGAYRFPTVHVAATDPFGLFWRQEELPVEGRIETTIVPRANSVDDIAIRPRQTRAFAGLIPARLAGSGTDFFGVRAYRSGDSLRHVNWRATARHDEAIYTNEYEQERVADIGLIVDARQRAVTRAGSTELLEHAVDAAVAFADAFLNTGNRVSLLVYGSFLQWTLPGYGKLQKQRIMRALSSVAIGTSQVFETLDYLPTSLFPAKSQIVLFSSLLPDDAASIRRMRANGYTVLVISPDPVDFERSLLPQRVETELAARVATIERRLLLTELRRAGARVVDWNVNLPLDQLVSAQLQRPPQLRSSWLP